MQKQLHRRITELYGEVQLPDKVWEILYHMSYQLGVQGVMNFKKTLGYIVTGQYKLASQEGMNSKWAKQTPNRARRLMDRLREVGSKD
jgi:lysozyme